MARWAMRVSPARQEPNKTAEMAAMPEANTLPATIDLGSTVGLARSRSSPSRYAICKSQLIGVGIGDAGIVVAALRSIVDDLGAGFHVRKIEGGGLEDGAQMSMQRVIFLAGVIDQSAQAMMGMDANHKQFLQPGAASSESRWIRGSRGTRCVDYTSEQRRRTR